MTKESIQTDGAKLSVYLQGPDWAGVPAATIGDFSCETPEAGLEALHMAIERVRHAGVDRIIGPMSG
ncbi:hypothetical protein, partial [Roseibium sp. RKSG952]|uniref:hypothetical protein n=1 Tax=Roseibium sp. RKSG952 TaxID=2529384 RepID=UPI0018AD19B1